MPSSGYTAISFTAGEQPTTAKWNLVGSNDASFNTGNGFNDAILLARHFGANQINQSHVDWTTTTPGGIWWQELGRNTLSSNGTSLTVNFTARKYLLLLQYTTGTGGTATTEMIRLNNDSSTNYDYRRSIGAAASTTNTGMNQIDTYGDINAESWGMYEISNLASHNKNLFGKRHVTYPTVGQAPQYVDVSGNWRNTSAQISRIDYITSTGTFLAGSEIIVLGHD